MLDGSILQRLAIAHSEPDQTPINFGVYYKHTLVALCHALEDSILASASAPLVMAAFQRGKWYLEEADRYGAIADCAEQIVILAAPDGGFQEHETSQRSNVALVGLDPTDPVAQEWHLVIFSPTYTAMVLCQELSPEDYGAAGVPTVDRERKFYGYWTFDPALVQRATALQIDHVGRYQPELAQSLQVQMEAIATQLEAAQQSAQRDDLGTIVARVVDYLGSGEQHLALGVWTQGMALEQNLISNELQALLRMAQLVDLTDPQAPLVASEVATLGEWMGQVLDLPVWQVKRLRLAGLLHRISPAQPLEKPEDVELSVGRSPISLKPLGPCCSLTSEMQALRRLPRLEAIARILTHQSEWWNGTGEPAGLQGEEIPLESQILALMVVFRQRVMAHQQDQGLEADAGEQSLERAWQDCEAESGDRWAPNLVEALGLLVRGIKEGMWNPSDLPPSPNRVSSLFFLEPQLAPTLEVGSGFPGPGSVVKPSIHEGSNLPVTPSLSSLSGV